MVLLTGPYKYRASKIIGYTIGNHNGLPSPFTANNKNLTNTSTPPQSGAFAFLRLEGIILRN